MENSEAEERVAGNPAREVAGNPARGVAGIPATQEELTPEEDSGSAHPKHKQTNKNKQRKSLFKTNCAPATTVENSVSPPPQEGGQVAGIPTTPLGGFAATPKVLSQHFGSGGGSEQASGGYRHNPSLDQLMGVAPPQPPRIKTLRAFPNREELPLERRMNLVVFDALWCQILGSNQDHTALKSYIWHTFNADDAKYLVTQCRRARNLYPYARSIVIAMMREEALALQG